MRARIELWGTMWDVARLCTEPDRSSGTESLLFKAKAVVRQGHKAIPCESPSEVDVRIAAAFPALAEPVGKRLSRCSHLIE